jgi:hypothetical protein
MPEAADYKPCEDTIYQGKSNSLNSKSIEKMRGVLIAC